MKNSSPPHSFQGEGGRVLCLKMPNNKMYYLTNNKIKYLTKTYFFEKTGEIFLTKQFGPKIASNLKSNVSKIKKNKNSKTFHKKSNLKTLKTYLMFMRFPKISSLCKMLM